MNNNLIYKCNLIIKLIIIFTVIYSSIKIIPTTDIIMKDKILIFLIILSSFLMINNYIK